MTIYHVVKKWDGYELESAANRWGEKAIDKFIKRWPEAEALADVHTAYVHCWETLEDAKKYAKSKRAQVLAINADDLDVEMDAYEFSHPMVRGYVPAEYICKVA